MYVCGWNVPGYLPDDEPMTCDTWEEARDALVWELERLDCDPDDEGAAALFAACDDAIAFLAGASVGQPLATAPVAGYVYFIDHAEAAQ